MRLVRSATTIPVALVFLFAVLIAGGGQLFAIDTHILGTLTVLAGVIVAIVRVELLHRDTHSHPTPRRGDEQPRATV